MNKAVVDDWATYFLEKLIECFNFTHTNCHAPHTIHNVIPTVVIIYVCANPQIPSVSISPGRSNGSYSQAISAARTQGSLYLGGSRKAYLEWKHPISSYMPSTKPQSLATKKTSVIWSLPANFKYIVLIPSYQQLHLDRVQECSLINATPPALVFGAPLPNVAQICQCFNKDRESKCNQFASKL